jgi:hypothetical protein
LVKVTKHIALFKYNFVFFIATGNYCKLSIVLCFIISSSLFLSSFLKLYMKNLFLITLATLAVATACKKDNTNTPAVMQVSGTLNAASEAPAPTGTVTGSGAVTGTYTPSTMVLNYTITYSGLTTMPATAGHFHFSAPGKVRPANVFYTFPTTTSPITGSVTLNSAQADSLMAGKVYANLHTPANPGGEIRANVVVK